MPLRPNGLVYVFVSMPTDGMSWSARERKPRTGTGYAWPVSNRLILPSSDTVKRHAVRISPQVSLR